MDRHIHIRPAVPDDWPTIVEFNCRLAEETEGKRLHRADIEAGVRAVLADARKGRYFVAVVDADLKNVEHPTSNVERPIGSFDVQSSTFDVRRSAKIVGQLMHTFEWSDWRNGDIWWLQSVYVHEDFRRRGVFRALFEHLCREAEADPTVVGLRLYVEEHNRRAHATYAGLGLAPGGYLVMERMLRRSDLSR